MTTCVIGLGKIGLPLAVQIAGKDEQVIGVDINEDVVSLVNQGEVPFPGERNLREFLAKVKEEGSLLATSNTAEAVSQSETVIVVVPVIVDANANPNFSSIDAATLDLSKGIRPGTLVSYETTLPIGTTRNRFTQMIQKETGMKCGEDIYIAYSPERVFSGRIFDDLRQYPKLVGGVDANSSKKAVNFYSRVLDFNERTDLDRPNGVWDLGSAEAAEMAKLVETTYRNVNIALANEFALHAESIGIDIVPVIEASNSQPFSHVHQPGIAVGGHCIPVYPKFYLSTHNDAFIPAAAIAVNESMPRKAVITLDQALADGIEGRKVAILGAAYRGNVKETAFSGVFALVEEIEKLGGIPVVHDPLYSAKELNELGFARFELGDSCDAAILQADHDMYGTLSSADLLGAELVFDGRRVLDEEQLNPISVIRLGSGTQ
ncbi:MAG TPA: nucleotide sugar dehydrogenase [Acidimicrobiales bacterium]|nr:nucleotide sugar dehydrogenase [Acidimicrobiales bacterium]